MLQYGVNVLHVLHFRFPDGCGPLDHSLFNILRGVDGCQTGGECSPAPPGYERVADGVGVGYRWFYIFVSDAQRLGGLLSDGCPGAAKVNGSHNHADGAVGIERKVAAGNESTVEPEAGGHTPSSQLTTGLDVNGRLIMVVAPGGFQALDQPDAPVDRTFYPPGTLFRCVPQPEFNWVYP